MPRSFDSSPRYTDREGHTVFEKQANLNEDFSAAFDIKTSEENLAWLRSVRVNPHSLRYMKDGAIDARLEKMYWEQEARYHQSVLINLVDLWMAFNLFMLICDYHPMFYDVVTPHVVKMRAFEDAFPVISSLRMVIFAILLYAKITKFFVGPNCEYLKSKWKVVIGMTAIQILEMVIAIYCIDKDPGMHCILILVIFNYTPIRLVQKAPICICVYIVWVLSFFAYCFSWNKDEKYKELWGFPKEESGFFVGVGCALCYNIVNLVTICGMFLGVQIYIVYIREEHLTQNLLAIKIGEAQSAIVNKRNKMNQMLLDSMLPGEITKELDVTDSSNLTYVESYTDVTVLFCMVNDFSKLNDTFNAIELVSILNTTYSYFDRVADEISMYKVETVGEVYMMAGGCPRRTVRHAEHGANMALEMVKSIPAIRDMLKATLLNGEGIENRAEKEAVLDNFSIKVGLNSGEVTAGVIGATCQRFKLFGDTVNTASRMESRSLPGMCQVSESTFKQLVKAKYLFKKREPMEVKGKGVMQTYFLVGRESEKTTVDHDKLEDLIATQDLRKLNFADVCKAAIKESQASQNSEYGELDAFSKAIQESSMLDDSTDDNFQDRMYTMNQANPNTTTLDTADLREHYENIYERLSARDQPQLPMNLTLLFLLGYDVLFIGPTAVEAMLEAHYRHHVYVKEKKLIRNIFTFFLLAMMFLLVYDYFMLEHTGIILVLRYSVSVPLLAIFIAFSFHKRFFYYQQTALCVICIVFGISVVVMETYQAPYPGYGLLLILFLVIFILDSLYFIHRLSIVVFLSFLYFVFLNQFCVQYQRLIDGNEEESGENHLIDKDRSLLVNMTDIGITFCAMQDSATEAECAETNYCGNMYLGYSKFLEDETTNNGMPVLMNAVKTELWKQLESRQTVAPFPAVQQIIVIVVFIALTVYPSWVSNYFSRVCFNRVQKEYEMEKEGKAAEARTTKFLNQLVPPSIVPKLSQGKLIADKLEAVTILFVDMVGFTKFSSQLDPDELVIFLNEMYSRFDVILEKYCLYKVEIIGDALFAVAGAPEEKYDKYHAARAVCAARGLLNEVEKLQAFLEIRVRIRIGVHTGSCVAGVVGVKDPRYHLFGATVSSAEKIESTGTAGKIHVSQATYDSIIESQAGSGINFLLRNEDDLDPLPADASQEDIQKRRTTLENIKEAKSRVGQSYFAEVNENEIMAFPKMGGEP